MSYSREQFARDLLAELDRGFDVVRIARWALSKKLDPDLRHDSAELESLMMEVVAMEEGLEFEYDEAELREKAQRVLDGESS